jgi:hypothetical protein
MKLRYLALACLFSFSVNSYANEYAFGFNPRTGDAWVDAQLGDMNVYTRGNVDGFVDDVVVRFGAPRYVVREYVVDRRWAPGDVYYACALAYQLHRPCIDTLHDYDDHRGQGWGVIAQRMGIKPGSAQFHALKGHVGKSNGKYKKHGKHDDDEYGHHSDEQEHQGNSGQHGGHKEKKSKGHH